MKTECEDDDIILKKMSENMTLNSIPSSTVEELRCSTCKKYLSHGPIQVLPDERSICGRCPPNNNLTAVREVDFERVVRYITFPCSFKQFGCTERVQFGQAIDHESVCTYRTRFCPRKDCMWEGPVSNVQNHLIEEHLDLFKDKASFKFQVDKNAQQIFLVKKGNVIFVVKYLYDTKDGILRYDIRYCNNTNVKGAHFRLGLINDTHAECNTNLKRTSCALYDLSFQDIKNAYTLNITKFLECLSNPDCIAVTVELLVECIKINISDELLKTLKCQVCTRYLIPPLYKLDNGTVCSDCAATRTNCQSLNDDKLLRLVTEVELPCRWEECEFSGKCKTLRKHESECQFKVYDCWCCSVKKLKITEAIDHYKEKHNAQYMLEKISLKINVNTSFNQIVIAKKNNVLILCSFFKLASSVVLNSYPLLPTDTNYYGTVNIEHQHCTFKPKPCKIHRDKGLEIDLKALPSCFKEIDPNLTFTVDFH